jgi:hypothetical protein
MVVIRLFLLWAPAYANADLGVDEILSCTRSCMLYFILWTWMVVASRDTVVSYSSQNHDVRFKRPAQSTCYSPHLPIEGKCDDKHLNYGRQSGTAALLLLQRCCNTP